MRAKKQKPLHNCEICGNQFTPSKDTTGRFCSLKCSQQVRRLEKLNGRTSWFNCCKCHLSLGFGLSVSARLISKDKSVVATGVRASGLKRFIPEGGSWRVSASIMQRKKKAWQDAWMDEYDFKFPEWKKSDFFSQYELMSDEQKREHNQRTMDRIKNCPIARNKKDIALKKWRTENADRLKLYRSEYMQQYKRTDQYKECIKRVRQQPINKIKSNLRKRMRDFLKKAASETMSISGLIGCNSLEFKHHIEKQFRRGMTWDNYGTHWHVDHILPCASFDHTNKKQVAQCWHYTNLRPLRATENMLKSDAITEPQMSLLI
jgi:hypothetical protein